MPFKRSYIIPVLMAIYLLGCACGGSAPKGSDFSGNPSQDPFPPLASQVPVPTGFPLSTQSKMQAIHHWNVLAEDVTAGVSDFLEMNVFERFLPVYVAPAGSTPFEKVFYNLLITGLVEKGVNVSRNRNEALALSFDVHMVRHGQRLIRTESGVYVSLAPGMYVRRQNPESITPETLRLDEEHVAGSRINVESGAYTKELPNVEIMITTSLTRNESYVMRNSSVYYINDSDWGNYRQGVMYRDPSLVNYRLVDR